MAAHLLELNIAVSCRRTRALVVTMGGRVARHGDRALLKGTEQMKYQQDAYRLLALATYGAMDQGHQEAGPGDL